MTIETGGWGALQIIALMAFVTVLTRWGGLFAMACVPINRRVRQCIGAMSGSVLVAILAPMALTGDAGARLALATTAGVMLAVRKPLLAIAAGVCVAALVRQI